MSRQLFLPYRLPQPGRFESRNWEIRVGSEVQPLPSVLDGWDFSTDLRISVQLQCELRKVFTDCGLPSHAPLVGVITWKSSRTGLRGCSSPVLLAEGTCYLSVELLGKELGGHLDLQLRVALGAHIESDPLSARRAGSTLWSESRSIILEGIADRFPVEVRNFQKAGLLGPQAAWVLHWDSEDPEVAASASVRLWLNSSHPVFADLVMGAGANPATLSFLVHDVTRQIVDRALQNKELSDDVEWPAGTLGATLMQRVRSVFPGISLEECRIIRREQPDEYESAIQTATGLLATE